jgi:hypothetical protein
MQHVGNLGMTSRKHELNLGPDFDPLDPAQVSDPKCWITGPAAEVLKRVLIEKISIIRHAPKLPVTPKYELDISDIVELDEATGKFRFSDGVAQEGCS